MLGVMRGAFAVLGNAEQRKEIKEVLLAAAESDGDMSDSALATIAAAVNGGKRGNGRK